MGSEELACLLTSVAAADELMAAIDAPALARARGWELDNWTYHAAVGSICFIEHDDQGRAA